MESLFNHNKTNILFNKSPLPFMGQKRNYVKLLYNILQDFSIDCNTIFLDCFGGSGLLSQTIRYYYPYNKVVWNDYDNFHDRLQKIEITREIFNTLRPHISHYKSQNRLTDIEKSMLYKVIDSHDEKDIDFITISTWFCFQTNYAINKEYFKKIANYNRMPSVFAIDNYKLYLNNIERVSCDYKELLQKYSTQKKNVILILDPPYLATEVGNYDLCFSLKDTLELVGIIKQYPQVLMFSSERSCVKELLHFLKYSYTIVSKSNFSCGKNKEYCFIIKG